MQYQIDPRQRLDKEAARAMREQCDRILRKIQRGRDAEAGFHATRKSIKRLRAALLLLSGSVPKKRWRPIYAELGGVARQLSPLRDLNVMTGSLAALGELAADGHLDLALAVLRGCIRQRLTAAGQTLSRAALGRVVETLEQIRRRLGALPLGKLRVRRIAAAAGASHDAARTAMCEAYRSQDGLAFHDWRKHVQRHWRHMQLLAMAWPDELGARQATASKIGQLIGQDHDLTTLRNFIDGDPQLARDPRMAAVLRLIDKRQGELRAAARPLGQHLLAERTGAFERRLRKHLKTARRHPDEPGLRIDLETRRACRLTS